jgi:hypothetical protein
MGRVYENGKPKCGSISGLLRKCEAEGTLKNPRRGYWEFSEDFVDKLYQARVDVGEFDRDTSFAKEKQDKQDSYREKKIKYLERTAWQHKQFGEMLSQLKEVNTMLFLRLYVEGAPKQMWVLDKYLVEGRKVIGILGQ